MFHIWQSDRRDCVLLTHFNPVELFINVEQ